MDNATTKTGKDLSNITEWHGDAREMTDDDLRRLAGYYWNIPCARSYHAIRREAERRGFTV